MNHVRFTTEDAIALANVIGSYVAVIDLNFTTLTAEALRAFARVIAVYRRPTIRGYGISLDTKVDFARRLIKHENARAAVRAYLMAGKRGLLPRQNRDMILKVAEELWATRDEDVWLFDREGVPSAPKKLRTADSCIGCFVGTPEQHEDTRRFCSSYCQFIHHHNLPDLRGMTPSQIESLIY